MVPVTLSVIEGLERGRIYQGLTSPIMIGREEDNDIQLNDERVSRVHAKIQEDRGQVILTEACPRMTERVLMFVDHLYTRQSVSGNFYLGSHTEFVGFDNRITLEKLTTFTRSFTQSIPMLSRLRALRCSRSSRAARSWSRSNSGGRCSRNQSRSMR